MSANSVLSLTSIEYTQVFLNINFLARYAYSPWCDKHPYLEAKRYCPPKEALGPGDLGNTNKFLTKMTVFCLFCLQGHSRVWNIISSQGTSKRCWVKRGFSDTFNSSQDGITGTRFTRFYLFFFFSQTETTKKLEKCTKEEFSVIRCMAAQDSVS